MRYMRIFIEQCKLSLMSAAIFRANFILMLVQSIINSLMSVLCVEFIYGSVNSIAGWNKNEMIILICTSLLVNQLYRGLINLNQSKFIRDVASGAFDRMLLRPFNIVFQINTGTLDISSLISLIVPLIIIFVQIVILGERIEPFQLILFFTLVLNGVIVLSAFMMTLYSMVFSFIKVDGLNNIYYMMMSISEKPKEIFSAKSIMGGFTFIIPAIPLANAPVCVLLGKESLMYGLLNIGVGISFFIVSVLAIAIGIKKYSSASS